MKLQGTASDGTVFHMWLEQSGLVASWGLFWSFCHIFRALCLPATLKRNMTGDFVGMTWTLCNGTLWERRCTYYTVCLCTNFLSWQIINQGEALVWAKGWFILLHSALCWAVHLNIRWWTRRVNMLCLSSHRETWTRWSISDISFCVSRHKGPIITAFFYIPSHNCDLCGGESWFISGEVRLQFRVYLRVRSDAYVMRYIQRIFSVESGLRSWSFLCYLTVWLVINVIIIQLMIMMNDNVLCQVIRWAWNSASSSVSTIINDVSSVLLCSF